MEPGFHKPGNLAMPQEEAGEYYEASMEPGFHKPGNNDVAFGLHALEKVASMEPGFHKPGNRSPRNWRYAFKALMLQWSRAFISPETGFYP